MSQHTEYEIAKINWIFLAHAINLKIKKIIIKI